MNRSEGAEILETSLKDALKTAKETLRCVMGTGTLTGRRFDHRPGGMASEGKTEVEVTTCISVHYALHG